MTNRELIARKVAQDINKDGEFINFGHGIPYSVGAYINPNLKLFLQNEAGLVCLGVGPPARPGDYDMIDSTHSYVSDLPGGAFFDIAFSFGMIRGGHIDKTILGALQVDEHANIANWMTPGKPPSGIGGAMDLCSGCREVLVAMESTTKDGAPKILKNCTYPLTATGKVTKVYTELGVFTVNPKNGFTLIEIFPGCNIEDIRKKIEPHFKVSNDLKTISL